MGNAEYMGNNTSMSSNATTPTAPPYNTKLSTSTLLKSSPTHFGPVRKLKVPLFYTLLPTFFQTLLQWIIPCSNTLSCLSWLKPTWNDRFLILIGTHLYRFTNGRATTVKGCPIPLHTIDVSLVPHTTFDQYLHSHDPDMALYLSHIPPNCGGCFTIRCSNGERRYYATSSLEQATLWVNSIRERQQEELQRKMGHANNMPYPKEWTYCNLLGEAHVQRNTRIKDWMREKRLKEEMEMVELNSGGIIGSVMPSGYYG